MPRDFFSSRYYIEALNQPNVVGSDLALPPDDLTDGRWQAAAMEDSDAGRPERWLLLSPEGLPFDRLLVRLYFDLSGNLKGQFVGHTTSGWKSYPSVVLVAASRFVGTPQLDALEGPQIIYPVLHGTFTVAVGPQVYDQQATPTLRGFLVQGFFLILNGTNYVPAPIDQEFYPTLPSGVTPSALLSSISLINLSRNPNNFVEPAALGVVYSTANQAYLQPLLYARDYPNLSALGTPQNLPVPSDSQAGSLSRVSAREISVDGEQGITRPVSSALVALEGTGTDNAFAVWLVLVHSNWTAGINNPTFLTALARLLYPAAGKVLLLGSSFSNALPGTNLNAFASVWVGTLGSQIYAYTPQLLVNSGVASIVVYNPILVNDYQAAGADLATPIITEGQAGELVYAPLYFTDQSYSFATLFLNSSVQVRNIGIVSDGSPGSVARTRVALQKYPSTEVAKAVIPAALNRVLMPTLINSNWTLKEYEWTALVPVGLEIIDYQSRDDLAQPWNDVAARFTLALGENIDPAQTYPLKDAIGQIIAVGRPIEPRRGRHRAGYGLQSMLGRMDTEALITQPLTATPATPYTPAQFLNALLTEAQKQYPWLSWEPVPDIVLRTYGGTVTPSISRLSYVPPTDPTQYESLLAIIRRFFDAFAGYDYGVTANNTFVVKQPGWFKIAQPADHTLTDADISVEGISLLSPRYKVGNAIVIKNTPWAFTNADNLIDPSSIRIVPAYFCTDNDNYEPNPFHSPQQPIGSWPPTLADSQGTAGGGSASHKEVARELLFLPPSINQYTALFHLNKSYFIPFASNVVIPYGSSAYGPLSLTVTFKQWGWRRAFDFGPPHPGNPDTQTATIPLDGSEVLVHDWSGNWSGVAIVARVAILKVWASATPSGFNIRIEADPTLEDFANPAIDYGIVLWFSASGPTFQKSAVSTQAIVGYPNTPGDNLADDYNRIPGLQENQATYGIQPIQPVTIDYWTLDESATSAAITLRNIADNIILERLRPARRWGLNLGPFGPLTPLHVGDTVAASFLAGLGVVSMVNSSARSTPGQVEAALSAEIEEIPAQMPISVTFLGEALTYYTELVTYHAV
jgi:hypothetical protein